MSYIFKSVPCSAIGTLEGEFMPFLFSLSMTTLSRVMLLQTCQKYIVQLGKGKKMLFYSFINFIINLSF